MHSILTFHTLPLDAEDFIITSQLVCTLRNFTM